MGYKYLSSFSTGELDPILRERTTLAKYNAGLATARNVIIGKTGSALSRVARKYVITAKLLDREVKYYCPPATGYVIEWGHEYYRIYNPDGSLLTDTTQPFTEDDLPYIHFETSGIYTYIFRAGSEIMRLGYTTGSLYVGASLFVIPPPATNGTVVGTGTPSGYSCDYAVSYMKSGQESLLYQIATGNLPIAAGQSQTIDARCATTLDATVTEMRVYRRPVNGGAYGFIGATSYSHVPSGTNKHFTLTDIGQAADYTHSPPASVIAEQTAILDLHPKTGLIYQQRLIQTSANDLEALIGSRPGFLENFYRDYPLNSDSALKFKCGTSGSANVLRMIESDGLVVFTTAGVFLNVGALSPTNISMERKGKWVINEKIPPLAIPGGVLFVDVTTNTVRNLVWSTELAGYNAQEVSIFSNHLFHDREVTSWAFQEGNYPLLWVTFDDGTFASFTYEFDQEMRAWTRHDSNPRIVDGVDMGKIKQVVGTGIADTTYFVYQKGSLRQLEVTIPRQIPLASLAADPQADMQETIAAMDGVVSWSDLLKDVIVPETVLSLSPVLPATDPDYILQGDEMTLDCDGHALFTTPGYGDIGTVFRWFDPDDGTNIDFEVVARFNDNFVTVVADQDFGRHYLTEPRLYVTKNVIDGLDSLEGEDVSVIVDGYIVGSPNNNIDNYPTFQVTGGEITLPVGTLGAIVHVGRPFTADIETLDIDTMEQAPTLIESITVNKLYVKVYKSAGLFVGSQFPADNLVAGMKSIDVYDVDYSLPNPITGNRYTPPRTKRVEITLPGDWASQGRVCIRQVDPIHFQLLSVIPDIEKLNRSDR